MLRQTVVLLAIVGVALAALSIGPLEPKPDKYSKQPGCYIKALDKVIPFGQAAPDNKSCMEYRCGETMITYVTCGAVATSPPCKIVEDKSKPYPACCPKIKC
ncbi:unnamed protein product [Danaus chrysippus]|uniref:(African queen) hypothetical protein n=1 Tax=Danaus chrysippus TaxID=151541 RepID=A0A8J2VUK0_9NEOP|nr:unnamed protein product [Danaus chrysippus]